MAQSFRKESLIADLAAARDRMGGHVLGLRRKMSPAEVIKRGSRRYPAALFGGAVLLGLLLSRIPARRRQIKIDTPRRPEKNQQAVKGAGRAAVAVTLLKFGLDMAKPAIIRWVRDRLMKNAADRAGTPRTPGEFVATTLTPAQGQAVPETPMRDRVSKASVTTDV